MEFQKVIESRRSIRRFDIDKKVSKESIIEMIDVAILAPSWKNSQTGRYYCITDSDKMREFRETCLPEFNCKNAESATAILVTTFVRNRSGFEKNGNPSNEFANGWGAYDLGLQNENLVLKAKDMGIDSIIMGIRDADKIRKLLNIPDTEIIVSVIGLGYGTISPDMPKRKAAEDIVKFI